MPAQFTPNGTGEQASTPITANPSQAEAGAQTQANASPQALTPDAIKSLFREELTAFQREQQSQRDKQEARINQRIDDLRKGLAAAGKNLTADEEQKARQAFAQEVQSDSPAATGAPARPGGAAPEAATTEQPAATKPAAPNPQTAAAWAVMEGEGLDIEDSDPEAKMIDWTSPQTAYKTTAAAIEAKRKRMGNAALPLTGGAPNNKPLHHGMNASQTLDMAFSQLLNKR